MTRRAPLALLLLTLIGCPDGAAPPAAPSWQEVPEAALTETQRAQRDRALAARDALAGRLMKRLQEAIGAQGPAAAISVCQAEAPAIAREVSAAQGLATGGAPEQAASGPRGADARTRDGGPLAPARPASGSRRTHHTIGRTSFRLRNQGNTPPAWAAPLVERKVEAPTFVAGPGGALGALLPLKTQPLCVTCHGPAETIAPDVKEALARGYPADAATGFQAGDLRGWVWVEVPAP